MARKRPGPPEFTKMLYESLPRQHREAAGWEKISRERLERNAHALEASAEMLRLKMNAIKKKGYLTKDEEGFVRKIERGAYQRERFARITLLRLEGKEEESLRLLKELIKTKPKQPDVLNEVGNAFYALGEHREAIKSYNKEIAVYRKSLRSGANNKLIHKKLANTLHSRGKAFFGLGQTAKAISSYNEAMKHYDRYFQNDGRPEERLHDWIGKGNLLFDRANAFSKRGYSRQASEDYQKAIELKDTIVRIMRNFNG